MRWKAFFGALFTFLVVFLLGIYWFLPFGEQIDFELFQLSEGEGNNNFSLNPLDENGGMQFYKNMRYSEKEISYYIDNCPLKRNDDMEQAFEIIENKTILEFTSVGIKGNEEISVSCDSKARTEGHLFIAGEGGPSNITQAGVFNVIYQGEIILIRDSSCSEPNVAIHELLHALGFGHSLNKKNIMYNVSKCSQTIGEDTLDFIDQIYSVQNFPDLEFENISASKEGSYINLNLTIRNHGLESAGESEIIVSSNGKEIETVSVESIGIGHGRTIILTNIFTLQRNIEDIDLEIKYDLPELDKDNNKITLKVLEK